MGFAFISCTLYLVALILDVIACKYYKKEKLQTTINLVVASSAIISISMIFMAFVIISGIVFSIFEVATSITIYNIYVFFVTLWLIANVVVLNILTYKKIKRKYSVE